MHLKWENEKKLVKQYKDAKVERSPPRLLKADKLPGLSEQFKDRIISLYDTMFGTKNGITPTQSNSKKEINRKVKGLNASNNIIVSDEAICNRLDEIDTNSLAASSENSLSTHNNTTDLQQKVYTIIDTYSNNIKRKRNFFFKTTDNTLTIKTHLADHYEYNVMSTKLDLFNSFNY